LEYPVPLTNVLEERGGKRHPYLSQYNGREIGRKRVTSSEEWGDSSDLEQEKK